MVPFKVIRHKPNALSHLSLPHNWKDSSRISFSPVIILMATTPLKRIPLNLGKRESHKEQDQMNKQVVPIEQCSSQSDAQCIVNMCIVVMKQSFVLQLISSCTLGEAYAARSLWRITDWSHGPAARPCCRQCPLHWLTWSILLTLGFVLVSLTLVTLEIFTDCYSAWILGHTQKSMSHLLWWLYKASVVLYEDTWWYTDTPTCGAPSDSHLAILAPFWHWLSSVIIFQTLSFYISS